MRRYVSVTFLVFYLVCSGVSACAGAGTEGKAGDTLRPAEWARPIRVEGVPNLYKVTDGLYRSAQPSAAGMKHVKELGIKTVLNLRSMHSDRDEIGEAHLMYEEIPMTAFHPTLAEAVRFLKITADPQKTPVLVHCQHGADRTGTMCAVYRIAVQGWSKEEAIREMTEGGYGFHGVWKNLVEWINRLDVGKLRKEAGVTIPGRKE